MTTWTSISNAAVAVGGIPSSTTVTALRDNPSAIAEASSGAPVMVSGWHPYDKVTIGDGKTGLIYDHAVTGTVPSVVTPDFVDGYEYRILALGLRHNAALIGTDRRLQLEAFKQTDAVYRLVRQSEQGNNTQDFGYHAEFYFPRLESTSHFVITMTYRNGAFNAQIDADSAMYDTPAQKILRARISFTGDSIAAGKVWMFRRREYASSP
jgi:hypothetical protein